MVRSHSSRVAGPGLAPMSSCTPQSLFSFCSVWRSRGSLSLSHSASKSNVQMVTASSQKGKSGMPVVVPEYVSVCSGCSLLVIIISLEMHVQSLFIRRPCWLDAGSLCFSTLLFCLESVQVCTARKCTTEQFLHGLTSWMQLVLDASHCRASTLKQRSKTYLHKRGTSNSECRFQL